MEAAPEPVVYTDDEMELDEELEAVARYEECRMVLGMSESLTNFVEAERTNPGRYVHAPCLCIPYFAHERTCPGWCAATSRAGPFSAIRRSRSEIGRRDFKGHGRALNIPRY